MTKPSLMEVMVSIRWNKHTVGTLGADSVAKMFMPSSFATTPSFAEADFDVVLSSAALASIIMGLSENASLTVPDPAFEADLDVTSSGDR